MTDRSSRNKIYALGAVIVLVLLVWNLGGATVIDADSRLEVPQPTPRAARYAEFPHKIKAHTADCGTCHKFPSKNWNKVRAGDDAFPDITDYPDHQSCIKCHKQQFFRGARPQICSICHTNPSPKNSARHPFPNPSEIFDRSPKGKTAVSDFAIGFPHDKHIEIVASHRRPTVYSNAAYRIEGRRLTEESCAVCHTTMSPQGDSDEEFLVKPPADIGDGFWLKKGTFKSAPGGHQTCFTCHSADTGILPAPSDCAVCHKHKMPQPLADFDAIRASAMIADNKRMLIAWQTRISSGTFRHEWFSHAELSCASCHNVTAMNTADPKTSRVAIASCAQCHVTPTSDDGGALNYEVDLRKQDGKFQCTKCHVTFGRMPIPVSHTGAIAVAGK